MGIRDLSVEASSVFDVHAPMIDRIKNGVVTRLGTNYMGAKVGRAITQGVMDNPVIFRTHGGRPNAIEKGNVKINIAFVAAPCADENGLLPKEVMTWRITELLHSLWDHR